MYPLIELLAMFLVSPSWVIARKNLSNPGDARFRFSVA
jgi:hypothetical protein